MTYPETTQTAELAERLRRHGELTVIPIEADNQYRIVYTWHDNHKLKTYVTADTDLEHALRRTMAEANR